MTADDCPSRALSLTGKEPVAGIMKWPTRTDACYALWRSLGTDCGIGMASCPFSHPNNCATAEPRGGGWAIA